MAEKQKEKQLAESKAEEELVEKQRQKSKNLLYGNMLKNEFLSKQKIKKQTNEIKSLH